MYVGGCGLEEEEGSESMKEGLTAWRILSDYPHYKLVTDYSDDLRQVFVKLFLSFEGASLDRNVLFGGQDPG